MRQFLVAAILVSALSAGPVSAQTPASHAGLLKSADSVAKRVAKLRGLKIKRPIRRGVMTKAQLKKRLLKQIDKEYSPAEIQAEELALKRFGLLPKGTKYLDLVVDLLTEQVAGFYDPWEKQLYIASFQSFGADILMAHEIDHALQDQHFNLRRFMDIDSHENDASVARQALVEGDGMALMIEFVTSGVGQPAPWGNRQLVRKISQQMSGKVGMPSFDSAPLFMREGLIFPYVEGLKFVAHFRARQPWKRIDRIYRKPPLSSEQIMHPKKYESYERPVSIVAKPLASLAGLKLVHHNVSGELGLGIWLRTHGVVSKRSLQAAAGWAGDRMAVYAPSATSSLSSSVGISYSDWDDEADAIEFFEAAADGLQAFLGKPSATKERRLSFAAGAIERRGTSVVFVVGAKGGKAAQHVAETFQAWKIKR